MKLGKSFVSIIACGAILYGAEPLMLSNAYDLALKNERKIGALALKTQASDEFIEQSKARLYPQIQGNFSVGYYDYEAPYLKKAIKESYTSYSLSAAQPLYRPDLWLGIDEAEAKRSAAQYQFQAQAQQLGLDVAKAYFNLLRTHRNIELLGSQKAYYESKYRQLEEMLKLGLTNRIDLLEAKVRSDKASSEWLTEQKRLKVASMHLYHLTNADVSILPSFDFASIDMEQLFQERSVWEQKLENNPTFKSAVAIQTMARHQVAIREYDHYPKVDLNLARKETYSQDPLARKYDNQAVVQVSVPIYQGGYTQSRVREALLLAESAQKERESADLGSKLHFEELWADHELNAQSLKQLRESEKSAELLIDSVEKGQKAGLKSMVDLLEAKAKLFGIKRDAIDAGYQLVDNYLGLLDVCGELNSVNIAVLENMILQHDGQ